MGTSADDMIVYVISLKELGGKKILVLIGNYSKIVGCKVDMQKSIVLLYTAMNK